MCFISFLFGLFFQHYISPLESGNVLGKVRHPVMATLKKNVELWDSMSCVHVTVKKALSAGHYFVQFW